MSDPSDEPAIERTTLVDQIVARLRADILDGRYTPGSALPAERQLAEAYGITRASLKNALVRLEDLGLIRTRHGIGSIVQDIEETGGADLLRYVLTPSRRPNSGLLGDILEARAFIAAAFVRLAAQRRSRTDLEVLAALLAEVKAGEGDIKRIQKHEYAFMRALAKAARNKAFTFVTNSIATAYWLHRGLYAAQYSDGAWVHASLAKILDAVRKQNVEGAAKAAQAYMDEGARRILSGHKAKPKAKAAARRKR